MHPEVLLDVHMFILLGIVAIKSLSENGVVPKFLRVKLLSSLLFNMLCIILFYC